MSSEMSVNVSVQPLYMSAWGKRFPITVFSLRFPLPHTRLGQTVPPSFGSWSLAFAKRRPGDTPEHDKTRHGAGFVEGSCSLFSSLLFAKHLYVTLNFHFETRPARSKNLKLVHFLEALPTR